MKEIQWRRIFAVTCLVLALLLIFGSIVLHIRHKSHLGRIHHESKSFHKTTNRIINDGDANTDIFDIGESEPDVQTGDIIMYGPSLITTRLSQSDMPATTLTETPMDEFCLHCVCWAATECQPVNCYGMSKSCGVYRISHPYWYDGGKQLSKQHQLQEDDIDNYYNCVNDEACAADTVAHYIKRYAHDCNRDGVVDCRDYILIHLFGPSGCTIDDIPFAFQKRMANCLAK